MNYKILTTVIASTILFSCGGDEKKEIKTNDPILVVVNNQGNTESSPYVSASGKIEAENSANVSTRMMGYVTKIPVKVGQRVAAGQLLVSIKSTDLEAKKAQVDAAILQATAGYNNAKKDYERFQQLFAQQSASQKELDDMTARFEMAKAGLEGAKQMRNEVLAQFSYSNIAAPYSGVVTNVFVKEGDMANPGMPLVSIEGAGNLQVTAMVSESNISEIKQGMPVKVTIKSIEETVEGKVSEVSLSAKNTGGQYLVKVNLTKPSKKILSGMFANVQFPIANTAEKTNSNGALLVPKAAIVEQGQLNGIYTVSTQNTSILRWVRLGKTYGDQVEILSGINANEAYIVEAKGKLFHGAKIQLAN
jgi:RND family efflux transporter MFP subunit